MMANMSWIKKLAVLLAFTSIWIAGPKDLVLGQDHQSDLNPQYGPLQAQLGDMAQIDVPAGYIFLDGDDTRILMRQLGNTESGRELGTIAKQEDNWFIVFEFDNVGYVKDSEKDQLDPDAILDSIREGTERANEYRQQHDIPTMQIVGWQQPPTYNSETNNLEWCIRAMSEGQPILNHNTRVLGRSGVMQMTLVVDPDRLESVLAEATGMMESFAYESGQKYSEWRVGDKVADYGLAALIAGGAAAVALKTGLLQRFIKPIIVGLVVVGGVVAKFFRRIFFTRGSVPEDNVSA